MSVEQFEGKFITDAEFRRWVIGKEDSRIENKGSDTISHFDMCRQVSHGQKIQIKAFVTDVSGILSDVSEQHERSLEYRVEAEVIAGGIVPTAVQVLKFTADIVCPSFGQVVVSQIGKIYEVRFLLIGETASSHTITEFAA